MFSLNVYSFTLIVVKKPILSAPFPFQDVYKPERKYKRHDADKLSDEESRVQSTLLEYGRYKVVFIELELVDSIACPQNQIGKEVQSTLVSSTSVISNNRLSRKENLILVLT